MRKHASNAKQCERNCHAERYEKGQQEPGCENAVGEGEDQDQDCSGARQESRGDRQQALLPHSPIVAPPWSCRL